MNCREGIPTFKVNYKVVSDELDCLEVVMQLRGMRSEMCSDVCSEMCSDVCSSVCSAVCTAYKVGANIGVTVLTRSEHVLSACVRDGERVREREI